jgi:MHS family proline/betaine transporter-like MFS transporter
MKALKSTTQNSPNTNHSNIRSHDQNNIHNSNSPLVKLGINIGVALEYYDFMIYGLLMPFITPLFFQSNDPIISSAKAFSVFALGYVARPLGGILFGQLADRKGRKNAFTSAMMLMGSATLLIGLLPTLNTTYSALPALLLIGCRLTQGLSFGAELPGAITITSENNDAHKRGVSCGFVISSTSIGAVCATGILALLTYSLSAANITNWGWRVPFLVGGLLAFISWYLRTRMYETPEFTHVEESQKLSKPWAPLFEAIVQHPLSILMGIGLMLLPAAMVMTNIYFASYLISAYGFESASVYSAMTLGLIAAAVFVPFFGWLSDHLGIKIIFISTCAGFCVACQHLFSLLDTHTQWGLFSFLILWQVFLCASTACVLPWLTQIFPTKVRFTGVSLCYNAGYLLCAFLPNIYAFWGTTNPRIIFHMLSVCALIGLVCALVIDRTKKKTSLK